MVPCILTPDFRFVFEKPSKSLVSHINKESSVRYTRTYLDPNEGLESEMLWTEDCCFSSDMLEVAKKK